LMRTAPANQKGGVFWWEKKKGKIRARKNASGGGTWGGGFHSPNKFLGTIRFSTSIGEEKKREKVPIKEPLHLGGPPSSSKDREARRIGDSGRSLNGGLLSTKRGEKKMGETFFGPKKSPLNEGSGRP